MKELINIKYWIFDLDNTLYSGQTKVFSEVDKKMSAFISKKMNVDLFLAGSTKRHGYKDMKFVSITDIKKGEEIFNEYVK